MNSFQNSDQSDFDQLASTGRDISRNISRVDDDLKHTNSLIQSGFTENRNVLSTIKTGIGNVGRGISNIYQNNKEDYGINTRQLSQNIAANVGGPLGVAIKDILNNSGISVGGIVKKSIGGIANMFHGHNDKLDGDISNLSSINSRQLGVNDALLKETGKQTHLQKSQIQQDNANTAKIINALQSMEDSVSGVRNRKTGKSSLLDSNSYYPNRLHNGKVPTEKERLALSHSVQDVAKRNNDGSSSSPSEVIDLLKKIAENQEGLKTVFTDPQGKGEEPGVFKSLVKDMITMPFGWKYWFSGRYSKDIHRGNNPFETMVNALIKIYEWERIGIDLSRRQLNEIIKSTGGQPQKYVGHEGAMTSAIKRMGAGIQRGTKKVLGDGLLGRTVGSALSLPMTLVGFGDEDFKDQLYGRAFQVGANVGKGDTFLDKITGSNRVTRKLYSERNTRRYIDSVMGADVDNSKIPQLQEQLIKKISNEDKEKTRKFRNDFELNDYINAINAELSKSNPSEEKLKFLLSNLKEASKAKTSEYGLSGIHGKGIELDPMVSSFTKKSQYKALIDKISDPKRANKKLTIDDVFKFKSYEDDESHLKDKLKQWTAILNDKDSTREEKLSAYKNINDTRKHLYGKEGPKARVGDSVIPVVIVNPSKKIETELRKTVGGGMLPQSVFKTKLDTIEKSIGIENNLNLAEQIVAGLEASKAGIAVRDIGEGDSDYIRESESNWLQLQANSILKQQEIDKSKQEKSIADTIGELKDTIEGNDPDKDHDRSAIDGTMSVTEILNKEEGDQTTLLKSIEELLRNKKFDLNIHHDGDGLFGGLFGGIGNLFGGLGSGLFNFGGSLLNTVGLLTKFGLAIAAITGGIYAASEGFDWLKEKLSKLLPDEAKNNPDTVAATAASAGSALVKPIENAVAGVREKLSEKTPKPKTPQELAEELTGKKTETKAEAREKISEDVKTKEANQKAAEEKLTKAQEKATQANEKYEATQEKLRAKQTELASEQAKLEQMKSSGASKSQLKTQQEKVSSLEESVRQFDKSAQNKFVKAQTAADAAVAEELNVKQAAETTAAAKSVQSRASTSGQLRDSVFTRAKNMASGAANTLVAQPLDWGLKGAMWTLNGFTTYYSWKDAFNRFENDQDSRGILSLGQGGTVWWDPGVATTLGTSNILGDYAERATGNKDIGDDVARASAVVLTHGVAPGANAVFSGVQNVAAKGLKAAGDGLLGTTVLAEEGSTLANVGARVGESLSGTGSRLGADVSVGQAAKNGFTKSLKTAGKYAGAVGTILNAWEIKDRIQEGDTTGAWLAGAGLIGGALTFSGGAVTLAAGTMTTATTAAAIGNAVPVIGTIIGLCAAAALIYWDFKKQEDKDKFIYKNFNQLQNVYDDVLFQMDEDAVKFFESIKDDSENQAKMEKILNYYEKWLVDNNELYLFTRNALADSNQLFKKTCKDKIKQFDDLGKQEWEFLQKQINDLKVKLDKQTDDKEKEKTQKEIEATQNLALHTGFRTSCRISILYEAFIYNIGFSEQREQVLDYYFDNKSKISSYICRCGGTDGSSVNKKIIDNLEKHAKKNGYDDEEVLKSKILLYWITYKYICDKRIDIFKDNIIKNEDDIRFESLKSNPESYKRQMLEDYTPNEFGYSNIFNNISKNNDISSILPIVDNIGDKYPLQNALDLNNELCEIFKTPNLDHSDKIKNLEEKYGNILSDFPSYIKYNRCDNTSDYLTQNTPILKNLSSAIQTKTHIDAWKTKDESNVSTILNDSILTDEDKLNYLIFFNRHRSSAIKKISNDQLRQYIIDKGINTNKTVEYAKQLGKKTGVSKWTDSNHPENSWDFTNEKPDISAAYGDFNGDKEIFEDSDSIIGYTDKGIPIKINNSDNVLLNERISGWTKSGKTFEIAEKGSELISNGNIIPVGNNYEAKIAQDRLNKVSMDYSKAEGTNPNDVVQNIIASSKIKMNDGSANTEDVLMSKLSKILDNTSGIYDVSKKKLTELTEGFSSGTFFGSIKGYFDEFTNFLGDSFDSYFEDDEFIKEFIDKADEDSKNLSKEEFKNKYAIELDQYNDLDNNSKYSAIKKSKVYEKEILEKLEEKQDDYLLPNAENITEEYVRQRLLKKIDSGVISDEEAIQALGNNYKAYEEKKTRDEVIDAIPAEEIANLSEEELKKLQENKYNEYTKQYEENKKKTDEENKKLIEEKKKSIIEERKTSITQDEITAEQEKLKKQANDRKARQENFWKEKEKQESSNSPDYKQKLEKYNLAHEIVKDLNNGYEYDTISGLIGEHDTIEDFVDNFKEGEKAQSKAAIEEAIRPLTESAENGGFHTQESMPLDLLMDTAEEVKEQVQSQTETTNDILDENQQAIKRWGKERLEKEPWLKYADFDDADEILEAKKTWQQKQKSNNLKKAAGVKEGENASVSGVISGSTVDNPAGIVKSVQKEPSVSETAKEVTNEKSKSLNIETPNFSFKSDITSVDQIVDPDPIRQEFLRFAFTCGANGINKNYSYDAWEKYAEKKGYTKNEKYIKDSELGRYKSGNEFSLIHSNGMFGEYANLSDDKKVSRKGLMDTLFDNSTLGDIPDELKEEIGSIIDSGAKNVSIEQLAKDVGLDGTVSTYSNASDTFYKVEELLSQKIDDPVKLARYMKLSSDIAHGDNGFYKKRDQYAKTFEDNEEFQKLFLQNFENSSNHDANWIFNPTEHWKNYLTSKYGENKEKWENDGDVKKSRLIAEKIKKLREKYPDIKRQEDGGYEGFSDKPIVEQNGDHTVISSEAGMEAKIKLVDGGSAFIPMNNEHTTMLSGLQKYIAEGVANNGLVPGDKSYKNGTTYSTDSDSESMKRKLANDLLAETRSSKFADGGFIDTIESINKRNNSNYTLEQLANASFDEASEKLGVTPEEYKDISIRYSTLRLQKYLPSQYKDSTIISPNMAYVDSKTKNDVTTFIKNDEISGKDNFISTLTTNNLLFLKTKKGEIFPLLDIPQNEQMEFLTSSKVPKELKEFSSLLYNPTLYKFGVLTSYKGEDESTDDSEQLIRKNTGGLRTFNNSLIASAFGGSDGSRDRTYISAARKMQELEDLLWFSASRQGVEDKNLLKAVVSGHDKKKWAKSAYDTWSIKDQLSLPEIIQKEHKLGKYSESKLENGGVVPLATGGIVKQPIIGEKGQEAIIPFNNSIESKNTMTELGSTIANSVTKSFADDGFDIIDNGNIVQDFINYVETSKSNIIKNITEGYSVDNLASQYGGEQIIDSLGSTSNAIVSSTNNIINKVTKSSGGTSVVYNNTYNDADYKYRVAEGSPALMRQ